MYHDLHHQTWKAKAWWKSLQLRTPAEPMVELENPGKAGTSSGWRKPICLSNFCETDENTLTLQSLLLHQCCLNRQRTLNFRPRFHDGTWLYLVPYYTLLLHFDKDKGLVLKRSSKEGNWMPILNGWKWKPWNSTWFEKSSLALLKIKCREIKVFLKSRIWGRVKILRFMA